MKKSYAYERDVVHIVERATKGAKPQHKHVGFCMHIFDARRVVDERPDESVICCACLAMEKSRADARAWYNEGFQEGDER